MPHQRRLEPARALVGSGVALTILGARLRDRLLGIGRDLDQIVAEEATALMRPQPCVQAVAREETAMISLFHDAPAATLTYAYNIYTMTHAVSVRPAAYEN